MTVKNKIEDLVKRETLILTWPTRIETLGLSDAQWCKNHDFEPTFFNRVKKMNNGFVAKWSTINEFEAALKADEEKLAQSSKKTARKNAKKA